MTWATEGQGLTHRVTQAPHMAYVFVPFLLSVFPSSILFSLVTRFKFFILGLSFIIKPKALSLPHTPHPPWSGRLRLYPRPPWDPSTLVSLPLEPTLHFPYTAGCWRDTCKEASRALPLSVWRLSRLMSLLSSDPSCRLCSWNHSILNCTFWNSTSYWTWFWLWQTQPAPQLKMGHLPN